MASIIGARNASAQDVEALKVAFVVAHEGYTEAEQESASLKEERNEAARALLDSGIQVVGGYRIVLSTKYTVAKGYEDEDSGTLADLDRRIAELTTVRKALAANQLARAKAAGRVESTSTISVREVA